MCGIYFTYSSESELINKFDGNKKELLKPLFSRGPDNFGFIKDKSFFAAHTLLSITGYREQPVEIGDNILLFNGEIFNDYDKYDEKYGDTEFLANYLEEYGLDKFDGLDGEYAIVAFDKNKNIVTVATDPFGTKPIYFQLTDKTFIISTFDSIVKNCNVSDSPIRQVPANTLLRIDLNDFMVCDYKAIHKFDFSNPRKRNYNDWNEAFSIAIKKRSTNLKHGLYLPLSSGHDSGVIAAELIYQKIPFHAYTVESRENLEILRNRIKILKDNDIDCDVLDISVEDAMKEREAIHNDMEPYYLENFSNKHKKHFPDPDFRNNGGVIAACIITKLARKNKQLIGLIGNGGDEIYCDFYYGEKHNNGWSSINGEWRSNIGPWPNFFGEWNKIFLGSSDRIASHYSVEGRFPLLDRKVVQEFLYLHPDIKASKYKGPLSNRMEELNFPMHDRKYGFSGVDEQLGK